MGGIVSTVGSIVGTATGLNSLFGGSSSGATPQQATTQAADPFAAYRGNLANMYSGFLTSGTPTNVSAMPGFAAYNTGVLQPALSGAKASAAASGQLYSGAESAALNKLNQQGYYGFMTDYLNRLAQGSGATQSPATAVGLGLGASQQQYLNQLSGLGMTASGLSNLGASLGSAGTSGSMMSNLYGAVSGGLSPTAVSQGYTTDSSGFAVSPTGESLSF